MTAATRSLDSKVSLVRVRVLLHQSAFFNEWRHMLVDAKFCLQSEQRQSRYTKIQTASSPFWSAQSERNETGQTRFVGPQTVRGKGIAVASGTRSNAATERRRKKKPRKEPADAQECEPQPSKKAATMRSESEIGPEGISTLFASASSGNRESVPDLSPTKV